MAGAVVFNKVSPINNSMNLEAVTVKVLDTAINGWARLVGFSLVAKDQASATLKRNDAQIRLISKPDHDPKTAGACYVDVSDVEACRNELIERGAKPGKIEFRNHENKNYRVFFLVEHDDGYCFCFGQRA